MVALRTVACSDRWEEEWPQISERMREKIKERAVCRQIARQNAKNAHPLTDALATPAELTTPLPPPPIEVPPLIPPPPTEQATADTTRPPGTRKPAADHPWR